MAVSRTTDADAVNAIWRASFQDDADHTKRLARPEVYALTHEHGCMICLPGTTPGECAGLLAIKPTFGTQDNVIGLIFECCEWMFLNTDAVKLIGFVEPTNTGALAAMRKTPSAKITDGTTCHHAISTIGQWAKSIGVRNAIAKLDAHGQTAKAIKLAARLK